MELSLSEIIDAVNDAPYIFAGGDGEPLLLSFLCGGRPASDAFCPIYSFYWLVFVPTLAVLALLFAPGLPPHDVEYASMEFDRLPMVGPYEENHLLEAAELLPSVVKGGTRLNKFKVNKLIYECI